MILFKPFFVAVFLIILAHGEALQAVTPACPTVAQVNAALKKCGSKNVGACQVTVGLWAGVPYGATKPLIVRTPAKVITLFGKPACFFQTNDVKLYLCNPGPCHKK